MDKNEGKDLQFTFADEEHVYIPKLFKFHSSTQRYSEMLKKYYKCACEIINKKYMKESLFLKVRGLIIYYK